MTLQEIKDQIAEEEGFSNWKDVMKHQFPGPTNRMMDEVAKRYACACCEASLVEASDKLTKHDFEKGYAFTAQDIITSASNIVLL